MFLASVFLPLGLICLIYKMKIIELPLQSDFTSVNEEKHTAA